MSVTFSYLLPVLLGLAASAMVALVFVLQRYVKRRDQRSSDAGDLEGSESSGNPYQPPSALVSEAHLLGAETRHDNLQGIRPVACVLTAFVVGGLSRWCRQIANIGGIHWEALVALLILVGLALLLVFLNLPARVKFPHLFFQLENFSLWLAFAFGWTVANRGLWDDFILFNVVAAGASAFIGGCLLAVIGRFRRKSSWSA